MSTSMESSTNNNEIVISISDEKRGYAKESSKKRRLFDLNEPLINTSPQASPCLIDINVLPNSQVSADDCDTDMGVTVDSQPLVPVQKALDLSSPHATKIDEQVNSSNGVKRVKFAIDLNVEIIDDDDDEMPIYCFEEANAKTTASASNVTKLLNNPTSIDKSRTPHSFDLEVTPDVPHTAASNNGNGDGTTRGKNVLRERDVAVQNESGSERKRKSYFLEEYNKLPLRCTKEPKVVVQIESEVTVPDDGYRWRKYGQKAIKGSMSPRSYYKCTTTGCLVRKQVERDSRNLKYVTATYEGRHNHEMPTARKKNQVTDNGVEDAANTLLTMALPINLSNPKPEVHTLPPHPGVGNNFMKLNRFGSFNNGMNFGSSSTHQMHHASLNNNSNTMPYSSHGLNLNLNPYAASQAGSVAPVSPQFPMSPPSNIPSFGNFSQARLNSDGTSSISPLRSSSERIWY